MKEIRSLYKDSNHTPLTENQKELYFKRRKTWVSSGYHMAVPVANLGRHVAAPVVDLGCPKLFWTVQISLSLSLS